MKLELKYIPEENPHINVYEDFKNCLEQLSECYNEIISDLQNKICALEIEKKAFIKALKEDNIDGIKEYLGIDIKSHI